MIEQSIVELFEAPIEYGFTYGSGAFPHDTNPLDQHESPLLDLIIGVRDTKMFHKVNMQQYPEHYSFMKYLGVDTIHYFNDHIKAHLYYHPYVKFKHGELKGVKYGVIDIKYLLQDLNQWDTLYVSGRMHKPIKVFIENKQIDLAQHKNLKMALSLSLLLLPKQFTLIDLYLSLASLSYIGDFRGSFEDPNKILKIVRSSYSNDTDESRLKAKRLHHDVLDHSLMGKMYHPILNDLNIRLYKETLNTTSHSQFMNSDLDRASKSVLIQPFDLGYKSYLFGQLPSHFKQRVLSTYSVSPVESFNLQWFFDSAHYKTELKKEIRRIISYPSIVQSFKGIFSAGILSTLKYSLRKIGKKYRF